MNASENAKGFAIIIDGPVASGKGTIARRLAEEFDGFHMNTGLMYRALTYYCLANNIGVDNENAVLEALAGTDMDLGENVISLNGEDVSEKVRERSVSQEVPHIAALASVREEMVRRQRSLGEEIMDKGQVVVVDARDGYVIFPDAPVKIYLTAELQVRAERRHQQMTGVTLDEVVDDTRRRDAIDMQRAASPLLTQEQAREKGYIVVDNSDLNEDQTVVQILQEMQQI